MNELEADVVVVGAGMAGLCAAIAARESGARVVVLEKGTRFGGSMRLSGGLIWTFADKAQLREEIPDGNQALQDLVVDGLWESMAWLEKQGVVLSAERRFQWYGHGRSADPEQMTRALVERLLALGGEILDRCSLANLSSAAGRIDGVVAVDRQGSEFRVRARSVILAGGGLQGNPELLARYVSPNGARVYLRGNPWSTGDTFLAATAAGAAVTPWLDAFYGHALAAPPARFGPYEFLDVTQRYGPISVALNLEGRRFCDESAGTGEEYLNWRLASQPGAAGVYVIDAELASGVPGFAPPRVAIERARSCGGPVIEAATLTELCDSLCAWGVNGDAALESLHEFNGAIEAGRADRLSPPRRKYHYALTTPPFSAVAVRPGITFSCGGLEVDSAMRVLRRASTVSTLPLITADVTELSAGAFPNLFAAGCDIGGISTSGYMGGLATALVTGRIAGEMAAAG